jgi:perosamine synthetase
MSRKSVNRRDFVKATSSTIGAISLSAVVAKTASTAPSGTLAIRGGEPVRTKSFSDWPIIAENDQANLQKALERKEWCRLYGKEATHFEQTWAQALGAKHCIGVVNGTSAIYAALNAVDAGPGDEVILSPYTFVATLNAVFQQYALPVFSDTELSSFQMDPASLESRINAQTRCILPVHIGGMVADMEGILQAAKTHQLPVVEDACQAHFAAWNGKKVATIGDIGCFSFQSTKILPCGEGGAVVTSDDQLYDRLHAFQNNGRDRLTGTRNGYIHQGGNLRITELQAAILNTQFTRFEEQVQRRIANARYLDELLNEVPGISPARNTHANNTNTYYLYMMDYDKSQYSDIPKNRFVAALREEGIPCSTGYTPLNKEPFIREMLQSRAYKAIYPKKRLDQWFEANQCPNNDIVCDRAFYFFHQMLLGSKSDIEDIVKAMLKIHANRDALAKG